MGLSLSIGLQNRKSREIKSTFERTQSLANVKMRNQTEICVKRIPMHALVLPTRALYATSARSYSFYSAARAIFSTPSGGESKREKTGNQHSEREQIR